MGISYPETLQDRLADLGNIPLDCIRLNPPPGQATTEDWLVVREDRNGLCELIDGTLVEKPMGWLESLLGAVLVQWLGSFVTSRKLGIVTGADGFTELYPETVRAPDVALIAWDRLPNGKLPVAPLPKLVPNFVIEILSLGNTYGEMSRKRREYFQAGVQLLWIVDHRFKDFNPF
jgi:Uma2 family endonuclease